MKKHKIDICLGLFMLASGLLLRPYDWRNAVIAGIGLLYCVCGWASLKRPNSGGEQHRGEY